MRLTSHNSHLSDPPKCGKGDPQEDKFAGICNSAPDQSDEFAGICKYSLGVNEERASAKGVEQGVVSKSRKSNSQNLVNFYLTKSQALNTRQAYRSDLEQYAAWGGAIPASPEEVASYLAEQAGILAVSTLKRRVAAIAFAHKDQGQADPTTAVLVKQVLKGIERHHGVKQKQARPLLLETLEQAVAKMDVSAKGVRNRALLLVGFYGAFRGSELLGLRIQDCVFGEEGVLLHLAKSKTDQKAKGRWVSLPRSGDLACPTQALENWIAISGYKTGFLFRPIQGASGSQCAALTVRSLSRVIQYCVKQIGIDPKGYSSHSLRAGFVTSQIEVGVDVGTIAQQTGHRSLEVLKRYDRPLAVRLSATSERLRELLPLSWNDKEVCNRSRKSIGQSVKDGDCRVFEAPFQSADIGSVNPSINRQGFLGETSGDPELPKIMSHDTLNLHAVK